MKMIDKFKGIVNSVAKWEMFTFIFLIVAVVFTAALANWQSAVGVGATVAFIDFFWGEKIRLYVKEKMDAE